MDPNNSPAESVSDCTFNYGTPGTFSLTIEVVDSVLYSATSNALNFTISAPTIDGNRLLITTPTL